MNTPASRALKHQNHIHGGGNSEKNQFNNNYKRVEDDYYHIYSDYFYNLLTTLITYNNAPETLDTTLLEWQLRNFGFARIGGTSADMLHILGTNEKQDNAPAIGALGFFSDNDIMMDNLDITNKTQLHYLTPANWQDVQGIVNSGDDQGCYVTLSNKFSYWNTQFGGDYTDFVVVDRVAKTLAQIKATANFNLDQMKVPFIGYTKNKNISDLNIFEQWSQGKPFIRVNEDVADINDMVQVANVNIPDFLPQLKDEWNNNLNELLTILGINALSIDKAERVNSQEASANNQLIEASGKIYLDARNRQLKLLNSVFGTKIEATFNQQSYQALLAMYAQNPVTGIPNPDMLPSDGSVLGGQQQVDEGGN